MAEMATRCPFCEYLLLLGVRVQNDFNRKPQNGRCRRIRLPFGIVGLLRPYKCAAHERSPTLVLHYGYMSVHISLVSTIFDRCHLGCIYEWEPIGLASGNFHVVQYSASLVPPTTSCPLISSDGYLCLKYITIYNLTDRSSRGLGLIASHVHFLYDLSRHRSRSAVHLHYVIYHD